MNDSPSHSRVIKDSEVAVAKWVLAVGGMVAGALVLTAGYLGFSQKTQTQQAEVFVSDIVSQIAPEDSTDLQGCIDFCGATQAGSQLSIQACTNTCLDARRQAKVKNELKEEIKRQVTEQVGEQLRSQPSQDEPETPASILR